MICCINMLLNYVDSIAELAIRQQSESWNEAQVPIKWKKNDIPRIGIHRGLRCLLGLMFVTWIPISASKKGFLLKWNKMIDRRPAYIQGFVHCFLGLGLFVWHFFATLFDPVCYSLLLIISSNTFSQPEIVSFLQDPDWNRNLISDNSNDLAEWDWGWPRGGRHMSRRDHNRHRGSNSVQIQYTLLIPWDKSGNLPVHAARAAILKNSSKFEFGHRALHPVISATRCNNAVMLNINFMAVFAVHIHMQSAQLRLVVNDHLKI